MIPRLLLASLLIVCMTALCRADSVQLKNGDRISGTILGIADGKLILKTDYAGVIRIEWSAIATWNGVKTEGPPPASLSSPSGKEETAVGAAGDLHRRRFTLNADFDQGFSFADSSSQLSLNVLSSYVGSGRWDGFLISHTNLDTSSTKQTFAALFTGNRYLTRHFFLFPELDLLHLTSDPPFWVTAQYAGGRSWMGLSAKEGPAALSSLRFLFRIRVRHSCLRIRARSHPQSTCRVERVDHRKDKAVFLARAERRLRSLQSASGRNAGQGLLRQHRMHTHHQETVLRPTFLRSPGYFSGRGAFHSLFQVLQRSRLFFLNSYGWLCARRER